MLSTASDTQIENTPQAYYPLRPRRPSAAIAASIKKAIERAERDERLSKTMLEAPKNPIAALRYTQVFNDYPGIGKIKAWKQFLTQEELAEIMGCTQGAVSKIESEILHPSVAQLGRLLNAGMTHEKLMDVIRYFKDDA